jgi:outer membrane protein OmpA-like peptidoglycan-associated protein
VSENRALAEKVMRILQEKAAPSGDQAKCFGYLQERLEKLLLLSGKQATCSDQVVRRILAAAQRQVKNRAENDDQMGDEDGILYLEHLVRACPAATDAYPLLGDLYFRQRQFGMAVEAYKKAKDDPGSAEALKKAEEMLAKCREEKGARIAAEDVRRLFKERTMAPLPGKTIRKLSVRNAIQTSQVLFGEWSAEIKREFVPQLKVVGEVVKEEFQGDRAWGLLIEGHTDRRGPLERNLEYSEKRAQAIKEHLVANFGIDPARLVTKGYGPWKPFSPKDDEAGWALNRRVEFKKIDLPEKP